MRADLTVLDRRLRSLSAPPRDAGRVVLVVLREAEGRRVLPLRARLSCAGGVVGDRWALGSAPKVEEQVTAMRADVARVLAGDEDIARFGDNLFLDLDLSADNLPPGTLLRVGTALCVVTPKPHSGCARFAARAGSEALAITRDPGWLAHRLRGIHLQVVVDGDVAPGDAVARVP